MIINRWFFDRSGMGNRLIGLDCLEGNMVGRIAGIQVSLRVIRVRCPNRWFWRHILLSINSSVSTSNLPPIGVNNEDGSGNLKGPDCDLPNALVHYIVLFPDSTGVRRFDDARTEIEVLVFGRVEENYDYQLRVV
ncbi:hypothetical protein OSB04_007509 [Centaurea solstitialis]|uniref:Uncharacterized protein n=1 Tax=Centaurea solstitialis TaxID=347529 RepID=A0AA38TK18_9ASTR|nr:hypothetical protein OSB04_007509 [Centaurea solstitialis]